MRLPIPAARRPVAGSAAVLIVILFLVAHPDAWATARAGSGLPGGGLDTGRFAGEDTERYANCQTGEDANEDVDCARVAVENSLYDYWSETLPDQAGVQFQPERDVVDLQRRGRHRRAATRPAPWARSTARPDATIYLDTTFFDDVLEQQLNGPSGAFVEPYVLAHEYGHHIQNLHRRHGRGPHPAGPGERRRTPRAAGRLLRRHVGAARATSTDDASGEALIADLTQDQDIDQAVAAAEGRRRRPDPAAGPGGSTRRAGPTGRRRSGSRWFMTGYEQGSLEACDTFSASSL